MIMMSARPIVFVHSFRRLWYNQTLAHQEQSMRTVHQQGDRFLQVANNKNHYRRQTLRMMPYQSIVDNIPKPMV